jgi:YrbI family 3-deoxy-D-manno-octulosonate 8-phosphate phosphatase
LGINIIKEIGIPQMILSTETNRVVEARAKKLGIPMIQGVGDKKKVLIAYCKENNFNPNNILYVGNDINDKEVMGIIGYPVAPSDAHLDIKKLAKLTLENKGGCGVVKELAEILNGRM